MTPEIPLKKQQEVLKVLAEIRSHDDQAREWTHTDCANALLVLVDITHSLAWKNPDFCKLPDSLKSTVAVEFVENLKQSVHLFTGIDPTKGSKTDDPLDADHIEETELEGK